MHRSGTSAMAGLLSKSGITAGSQVVPPSFDNPKGFFENKKIVDLNIAILNMFNQRWDNALFLPPKWHDNEALKSLSETAAQFMDNEFENEKIFLIKDPRISILLPFWIDVCQKSNVEARCLIVLRHPDEVTSSLYKRNYFDSKKSEALYSHYNLLAERESRDLKRLFISFEELYSDPKSILQMIQNEWKTPLNTNAAIETFIDPNLVHHRYVPGSSESQDSIPAMLYKSLLDKKLDYEKLEELWLNHIDLIEKTIKPWLYKRHYIKILSDEGQGFSEKSSLSKKITSNSLTWRRNLSDSGPFRSIKILPANASCICRIEVELSSEDGQPIEYSIHNTSDWQEGDLLYFMSDFPQVQIDFPSPTKIKALVVHVEFLSIGKNISGEIGSRLFSKVGKESNEQIRLLRNRIAELKNSYYHEAIDNQQEINLLLKEAEIERDKLLKNEAKARDELKHERDVFAKKEEEANQIIQDLRIRQVEMERSLGNLKLDLETGERKRGLLKKQLDHSDVKVSKLKTELKSAKKNIQTKVAQIKKIETEKKEAETTSAKIIESNLTTIDKQHKEILKFKKDYADREDELNRGRKELTAVKSSLSYYTGQVLTFPFRMIYEGITKLVDIILLLSKMAYVTLQSPTKAVTMLTFSNVKTLAKALFSEHPIQVLNNFKRRTDVAIGLPVERNEKIELPVTNERVKTRILYISPNLPSFDESSGGRRATHMLELLAEEFEVIAFTLGARPQKYIDKLLSCGVNVLTHGNMEKASKEIGKIDVIIYAWFYTLHDASHFMNKYPGAKIIVDSVDVHWVREERSLGSVKGLDREKVSQNKKTEIASYGHADIIWAVTENDKRAILEELPIAKVDVVSNIHGIHRSVYEKKESKDILFFGGYGHPPNIVAVKKLATEIFPKIYEKHPDAQLIIAGSKAPEEVIELAQIPGIVYKGFIAEEDLDSLYDSSAMTIVPLVSGAGIKGKICEAISYRLPVITNAIGNEGIHLIHEIDGLLAETPEEMVDCALTILDDQLNLETMTTSALNKMESLVGPRGVKNNMVQSICSGVSICIVTWNRLDLLRACIDSVLQNTVYPDYRIIVWSNGCTDGTQEYLNNLSSKDNRVVAHLSKTNEVFVRPNNQMMLMYPQDDIVLLNNDTTVTIGWLTALRKAAYLTEKTGIAGSKILYPDGRLQEFGSELYSDGTGKNIGKWQDPSDEAYQKLTRVGYVSGCSMYIRRTTVNHLGVFDDQFHPCYCEDSDFCYTAWENGIETVVTPESIIYHFEGGTSGTDEDSGFKSYQKINFEKFLEKHQRNLESIAIEIQNSNSI